MTDYELEFVETVLKRKPNLQIYRPNQKSYMGDFVVIDCSDVNSRVGWIIERKMAEDSSHAGTQLSKASAKCFYMGDDFKTVTGNVDEVMNILTPGRGKWNK
ncbi:hypothetical protein QUF72_16470 [Desulfobacterales bacterium HSG2]|nr:hypothetical protein [Desulfobacterales bacterium HSG2]